MPIRIRRDSRWNVPEPELTLVINAQGEIVGFCAGNDVSSRDIEGENPLYLPQAKIYDGSCALGPGISLCDAEHAAATSRSSSRCMRAGRADLHRRNPHVADQAAAAGAGRLPAEGAGFSARRFSHDRHRHRPSGRLLAGSAAIMVRITIGDLTLENEVGP